MATKREPVRWLTYPGDHRQIVPLRGHIPLGPNELGELLYPVAAEYDEAAHKTRVGLSFIAPPPGGVS